MKNNKDNQRLEQLLEELIHREIEEFDFDKWAEKYSEEVRQLRSSCADFALSKKNRYIPGSREST